MILEFIGNAPKEQFLRVGVNGNNLVDELVMIIGRKHGKVDLFEFTPKMKITNSAGDFAEYSGDDLILEKIEERDTVKLTYIFPDIVTEQGNVDMQIVFEKPIEDGKVKEWQTLPFNVTFPEGINESTSLLKAYPNVVKKLIRDVNDILAAMARGDFVGEQGPRGDGFITMEVDENGDLYAYTEEESTLSFEYDESTGNLYIIQEV